MTSKFPKSTVVSCRLQQGEYKKLMAMCRKRKWAITYAVEMAVCEYLTRHETRFSEIPNDKTELNGGRT